MISLVFGAVDHEALLIAAREGRPRRRVFNFRGPSPIAVDVWLLQPLSASRNATLGQPSLQGGRAKYALTQWSVVVGG